MFSASPIIACLQRASQARQQNQINQAHPPSIEQDAPTADDEPQNDPGFHQTNTEGTRKFLHNVWDIAQRASVVTSMIDEVSKHGEKNISSNAVKEFPNLFRSSPNANITRALRLWKARHTYFGDSGTVQMRGSTSTITRRSIRKVKRVNLKARSGRGRKRASWVEALHCDVRDEFDRLRKLGVKFNVKSLRALALNHLVNSKSGAYSSNMIDSRSGKSLNTLITSRWIQHLMDLFQITSHAHTGKDMLSTLHKTLINKTVAYHLGVMKLLLTSGEVDEMDIENADEKHFLINVDNGRTLGFSGDSVVKYAEVVSGGEKMKMLVRISGGRDGKIHAPFIVFNNPNRRYPIRGITDNVPGVSYRTEPKGWIDTAVMTQYLSERREIAPLTNGRRRLLFLDNCSGHLRTNALDEATHAVNTELRYFPPNCTYLIQPCHSFVMQKIKSAWTSRWEEYKIGLIREGKWKNTAGKLFNPGKTLFLRLAAAAVRDVNNQRDSNGVSYARKAMIRTGMSLNLKGCWEETQLTPELQEIIRSHRNNFEGLEVGNGD